MNINPYRNITPFQVLRKRGFRIPGGHGRTWVEQSTPGRTTRHISLWIGQRREDVNRHVRPLLTVSVDIHRNHAEERRRRKAA